VGYSTRFSALRSIFFNIPDVHRLLIQDILRGYHWFLTLGYTFRVFFGPFRCTWNRELLAQTETRTMHFITLTVPPPRTDHSLIHNSTRSMSPGQKDLQAHFRENVRFRPFSLVIAHDFQHLGQFFCNLPDVHRLLVDDIWWGFTFMFGPKGTSFGPFRPVYLPLEPRITFPNGSQNDAFRHSDGPSSTYQP
jgi:hypothetical protein